MQTKPAPSSPTQCPYIQLQVIRLMHTTLADRGARWHKSALCHNSHTMLLSLPTRQSNTACLHSTANPPHTVTNLPTHSTDRKTLIRVPLNSQKNFLMAVFLFFPFFFGFSSPPVVRDSSITKARDVARDSSIQKKQTKKPNPHNLTMRP